MISKKKLINMARKWHKLASRGKKIISILNKVENVNAYSCSTSTSYVADRGYFVIYSADKKRFVLPLACIHSNIFRELLEMSEEEFGLSSGGPIRLPCDSVFLNYIVSLFQRGLSADLEKALLNSISICRFSSTSTSFQHGQQQLLCSYWMDNTRILYSSKLVQIFFVLKWCTQFIWKYLNEKHPVSEISLISILLSFWTISHNAIYILNLHGDWNSQQFHLFLLFFFTQPTIIRI